MEDERPFGEDESGDQGLAGLGSAHCFPHLNGERVERYSRKVFVGGLPPDIDEGKDILRLKGMQDASLAPAFKSTLLYTKSYLYLPAIFNFFLFIDLHNFCMFNDFEKQVIILN